jgi:hypothetical protein
VGAGTVRFGAGADEDAKGRLGGGGDERDKQKSEGEKTAGHASSGERGRGAE